MKPTTTALCESTADDIQIRGRSLPRDMLGKMTFTQMIWFHLTGRDATVGQVAVLDACLVALMEHGLTPTAITARLTYSSAPEAMQGAVAAGLLSVGSLFVGTSEACAVLLHRVSTAPDPRAEAASVVAEHRARGERLPGFGHPVHRPEDPRTPVLLGVARQHGLFGVHCQALGLLSDAVREGGRSIPVNATGAIAAVLADAGIPPSILRGIALISRCAGLVGHLVEEQRNPTLQAIWHAAEAAVPYAPDPPQEEP